MSLANYSVVKQHLTNKQTNKQTNVHIRNSTSDSEFLSIYKLRHDTRLSVVCSQRCTGSNFTTLSVFRCPDSA